MPLIHNAIDLGAVIRAQRLARGISQKALADQVGVSRQWVVAVEKGKPGAELARVLRTLAVLGLSVYAGGDRAAAEPDALDLDRLIDEARTAR